MNATFENIQQDHQQLHQQLIKLHRVLCERHQSRDTIVGELTQLRDQLAVHFRDEDEGGFFDDLLERLPEHAQQIVTLRTEHTSRLRDLDVLIQEAANQPMSPVWWDDLASRFHEVSRLLMSHELQENVLLQMAYGLDLGALD